MRFQTPRSQTPALALCVLLVVVLSAAPPTAAREAEALSLTVTIESRHITYFEVCMPVKVGEPFRVVWGNKEVRDSVEGVVQPPEGGEHPVTFKKSEGGGNCLLETIPKLKLGEPHKMGDLVSSLFNHYDGYTLVLQKGGCK